MIHFELLDLNANMFSVGWTMIVKQMILSSYQFIEFIHYALNDIRTHYVMRIN